MFDKSWGLLLSLLDRLIKLLSGCADPRSHLPKATSDRTMREYLEQQERYRKHGPV
ncbi:MAG TPA: hypothetical protein VJB59_07200 [Bdellovibrionota bacterium]|nr:hypothetical protein [Bdellovibrionota bacterium]